MFNAKRKYFKTMLRDTEKVIWDLELKKYTALQEREVTRRQYDQGADALSRLDAQLQNPQLTKEQKAQLEANRTATQKTVNDLKKHIDNIDGVISGAPPSESLPDGAEGIDNKLSSWVQRREYIKNFITRNT